MEADIADVNAGSQRHAEGLNGAVQVLVVQSVFIVPDALTWIGYLVTHKPDTIVPRIRLVLVHCRAGPSHDGWLHPNRVANR